MARKQGFLKRAFQRLFGIHQSKTNDNGFCSKCFDKDNVNIQKGIRMRGTTVFKVTQYLNYEDLAGELLEAVSKGLIFQLDVEDIPFPLSKELEIVFADMAKHWPREWGHIWQTIQFSDGSPILTIHGIERAINTQISSENFYLPEIASDQEREAFLERYKQVLYI